jgi:hypothetical protein
LLDSLSAEVLCFVDLFKLLAIILLIVSVPGVFALFFFWFTRAGSRITRRPEDWD